jgi:hypothetical protein
MYGPSQPLPPFWHLRSKTRKREPPAMPISGRPSLSKSAMTGGPPPSLSAPEPGSFMVSTLKITLPVMVISVTLPATSASLLTISAMPSNLRGIEAAVRVGGAEVGHRRSARPRCRTRPAGPIFTDEKGSQPIPGPIHEVFQIPVCQLERRSGFPSPSRSATIGIMPLKLVPTCAGMPTSWPVCPL